MKTWQPDTCECIVEELYEGTNIIGMGEIVRKCEAHQSVADEELYGVLYSNPDSEQKRKNGVHRELLESELGEDTPNGRDLAEGLSYEWSFEGEGKNRVLKVHIPGATAAQKSAFKNGLTNLENKVIIE